MTTLVKQSHNYDVLNIQIDECRERLIQSAATSGLTSSKTLLCSEELDALICDMQVHQQSAAALRHEQNRKDAQALEKQIDEWREKMIKAAGLYGFTSPETLHCSEQLDTLIFQVQTLNDKKKIKYSSR